MRVVLVSTRNPLNIGAAARAMANFGFSRLRVVNPYDVAFREARSAVGAAPLLQKPRNSPPSPTPWPIAAWSSAPPPSAIASSSTPSAAWSTAPA